MLYSECGKGKGDRRWHQNSGNGGNGDEDWRGNVERVDPTRSNPASLRSALRLTGLLGFFGGFLLAYQQSTCKSTLCWKAHGLTPSDQLQSDFGVGGKTPLKSRRTTLSFPNEPRRASLFMARASSILISRVLRQGTLLGLSWSCMLSLGKSSFFYNGLNGGEMEKYGLVKGVRS